MIETFKDCVGQTLAAITHPDLQDWAEQKAAEYAVYAYEQLADYGDKAEAEAFMTWWTEHPRNPMRHLTIA